MKIEDLTQEKLDQILHEKRIWIDRFYMLFVIVDENILEHNCPVSIFKMRKWASEANDTYNKEQGE